jgi:hypothetical protein
MTKFDGRGPAGWGWYAADHPDVVFYRKEFEVLLEIVLHGRPL